LYRIIGGCFEALSVLIGAARFEYHAATALVELANFYTLLLLSTGPKFAELVERLRKQSPIF
jgi:hypothetical protein